MNVENNQNTCNSGMCGHGDMHGKCGGMCGGNGHMHILKWAIKIAVLMLVFCFGFQFGELKGRIEGMYGQSFHHRYYDVTPMMYGGSDWGAEGSSFPAAGDSSIAVPNTPAPTTPTTAPKK